MDALSDILRTTHLSGGVYFRCEFSAPWGMQVPGTPMAEFHIIVRGQCWLRVPGEKNPLPLRGGVVVVFLTGGAHALLDNPKARALPPEVVLKGQNLENFGPVTFGGGGVPATVLCGYFRFDPASRHPLIGALPPFIHIRDADGESTASLQTVVSLMMQETRAARPGAEVVINRLCEVLFIRIVRAFVEQSPHRSGILAALADPYICAALNEMHRSPERSWTLAELASRLGLSRSAFAARFHELVGQTPMQYLTAWRMETARRLLSESRLSTAVIAERVGYGSEAAFAKVFKRVVGMGPGAYRRADPAGAQSKDGSARLATMR
jgi:AraC-like DNA-binding protein